MKHHRTFKLFLAGLLAVALAGCLPIPVIDIDPTTPEAGESFTVDGSGTVVSNVPEGTVVASYAWDFGDGEKGQGAQVDHVYDEPGEYTITLTVTDSAGRVAEAEQPVTVKPASPVAALLHAAACQCFRGCRVRPNMPRRKARLRRSSVALPPKWANMACAPMWLRPA